MEQKFLKDQKLYSNYLNKKSKNSNESTKILKCIKLTFNTIYRTMGHIYNVISIDFFTSVKTFLTKFIFDFDRL